MKANELMIGDNVRYISTKKTIIVDSVLEDGINYYYTQGELDWIDEDRIEPIPLTEEILKANGFVVCSTNRYMNMSNGVDIIFRKNYIRICVSSNRIDIRNKSVHSFQHALRLVGKNELADNFKV